MASCTKVRLPALQHCPWLKNKAECAYSTAVSISAVSAKTILGLFPPSSSVTRFRLEFAAAACIILPTLRRMQYLSRFNWKLRWKRALGFLLKIELCQKHFKFRMQFCLGALNNVLYVFLLKFSSFTRYYVCKKACICGLISTWPEGR